MQRLPLIKGGRTVGTGVVSAVLVTGLSWALIGCSDSSPLRSTAPQVAVRALAATTGATTTEFDGFINFCRSVDPTFTFAGRTVHFRVSNENMWVTDNALISGIEHNTGIALIDPHGLVVNLDNSLQPNGVNGTWEIKQQFRIQIGRAHV